MDLNSQYLINMRQLKTGDKVHNLATGIVHIVKQRDKDILRGLSKRINDSATFKII